MDYKKKYEEALKTAKTLHGLSIQTSDDNTKMVIEELFPELGESEDERIRKELIRAFTATADKRDCEIYGNGITYGQVLSWLEKQGLLNNDKYQTVPVEILDRLYESEKELERLKQKPFDYENANIKQKAFAPKIEPKFKVGDWIVYCNEDVDLITGIEDKGYIINKGGYIPFSCEGDMRYWTIQDANDGDIISTEHGEVFIYSHRKQLYSIAVAHCFLDNFGYFYFDGEFRYTESIHPATKEQRELLFTKMKESGYKWDAEKKELKKIEQNPVEPVTVIERDGEKWVRVCALGEDFIIAAHDYRDGDKAEFTWEEACNIGTFSKKQGYIMLTLLDEINAKLEEIGGEPLDSSYWSSSEYYSYNAWNVCFKSGLVHLYSKCYSLVARAVAAF